MCCCAAATGRLGLGDWRSRFGWYNSTFQNGKHYIFEVLMFHRTKPVTPLAVMASCLLSLHGASHAINKCVDGGGKVSYQDAPCASAGLQVQAVQNFASIESSNAGKTAQSDVQKKVRLLSAVVAQELVNSGTSIKFSLRPQWTNYGEKVRVSYKVQLLDGGGKELNSYTKFKDLDHMGSSSQPAFLDLVNLDKPGGFDYKNVVKARVVYTVGNDKNEVILNGVKVIKE